ncbi:MAG: hypothetical protein ACREBC_11130, partial [Pyrinomonadaceae bacterium]
AVASGKPFASKVAGENLAPRDPTLPRYGTDRMPQDHSEPRISNRNELDQRFLGLVDHKRQPVKFVGLQQANRIRKDPVSNSSR